MLISIMIFASLTGNKTGPIDIWSKEYTPSGPTSNYLDRSKVQWSKWIGPRNTLTPPMDADLVALWCLGDPDQYC